MARPRKPRDPNAPPKRTKKFLERYDWEYWQHIYVTGDDRITLESISLRQNAPSFRRLSERCAEENWPEKRRQHREKVRAEVRRVAEIDTAQMQAIHLRHAQMMTTLGARRLAALYDTATGTWKEQPTIQEARLMVETGIKLERLIVGESTENIRVSDVEELFKFVLAIVRDEVNDRAILDRISQRIAEAQAIAAQKVQRTIN